jgi:hypothetical protein
VRDTVSWAESTAIVELGSAALVCLLGLVLAFAHRHRLGRSLWLAVSALIILAMVYIGTVLVLRYLHGLWDNPPIQERELTDAMVFSDRMTWVFSACTVVGFALLIAALVVGPRADNDTDASQEQAP